MYAYNKITDNWSKLYSSRKYVEKAKKLGISCKPLEQKNTRVKNANDSKKKNIDSKSSSISKNTRDAEDKCTEIGFKKGTEKYGDCVLKMLELI